MYMLKSVGVMSVAKITGLLYGCLGLILMPVFLLLGLVGSLAQRNPVPLAGLIGIVLAILLPIFYGSMGFVIGALSAWLYNLLSQWVGGVELELIQQPDGPIAPYPIVPPATPTI